MEDTTTPSPDYLKGFNEGYTLSKNEPELADKLSAIKSDSERMQGLRDGRRQFVLEKTKEHRKGWIKDSIENSKEKNSEDRTYKKDIDRDH